WWCARQPGAVQGSFRIGVAVVGRAGFPGQRARCRHRDIGGTQFGERGGYDVFVGSLFSALSEISVKSACAFPMMSSAIRVFFSSDVNVSFCRRSFSNSTCSAVFFARFTGVVDSTGPPVKAPASRARAHSIIWQEYH